MNAQPAADLLRQPQAGELLAGTRTISQIVSGVPVSLTVSAFLSGRREGDQVQVQARIVADLGDLQQKIGSLIDTLPWPTDDCSHFSADNLVVRVWGKKLSVSDNLATLELKGDVDDWLCAKNPLPCTRLVWDEKNVLGVTIRTPRNEVFDCNPPIKSILVNQPLTAKLPFRLVVVDAHTVVLAMGTPTVDIGGKFGSVTGTILRVAGVNVSARAEDALEKAFNPELLKRTLPDEILGLEPKFTAARFLDNSGHLLASLVLSASVAGKDVDALVRLLLQSGHDGSP